MLRLYLQHPAGLTDEEISLLLRVSRPTVYRLRMLIEPELISRGHYSLAPDAMLNDLAQAILHRNAHRI